MYHSSRDKSSNKLQQRTKFNNQLLKPILVSKDAKYLIVTLWIDFCTILCIYFMNIN